MKKFILAFAMTVTSGLAVAESATAPEPEKIFGQSSDFSGLTFQVYSGGCTSKNSFKVRILESFPVQVELVRTIPDYCRAYFPYGQKIKYSWQELGLSENDQLQVINDRRIVTVHQQ